MTSGAHIAPNVHRTNSFNEARFVDSMLNGTLVMATRWHSWNKGDEELLFSLDNSNIYEAVEDVV